LQDAAVNPRDNLSLPQLVRKIVLTASYGDWKHVDNCLRRYGVFAVNICMFPSGWNALHIAVCKGDEEMVRGLIAAGTRSVNADGLSLFKIIVLRFSMWLCCVAFEGARPNQAADADGWTPLMLACKYQVRLSYLICCQPNRRLTCKTLAAHQHRQVIDFSIEKSGSVDCRSDGRGRLVWHDSPHVGMREL
jgi:ankyrin repeat protein